jgi:hypothetical protein
MADVDLQFIGEQLAHVLRELAEIKTETVSRKRVSN